MLKRSSLLSCVLILTSAYPAVNVLPGGHVAPVEAEVVQVAEGQETRLRRPHTVRLLLREGEEFKLVLRCLPVGSYTDSLAGRVVDAAGAVLREVTVPRRESAEVVVPDAKPGLYTLRLDAGQNACSLRTDVRHVSCEASEGTPLRMIYHAPRLHFWVPVGSEKVSVRVAGGGAQEAAAFKVFDGSGKLLAAGDSRTDRGRVDLDVKAGQAAGAWSVTFEKLGDVTFEDFSLTLAGDAVPFVAESAARLVVPAMHAYALVAEGKAEFGVRVNASAQSLMETRLRVALTDQGSGAEVFSEEYSPVTPGRFGTAVPAEGFLNLKVTGRLVDGQGKTVLSCGRALAAAHGDLFEETVNLEAHTPAPPSKEATQRGYQVFGRAEPGDIRPNSRPRPSELTSELRAVVTPGEIETLYFALYPLSDASTASVTVGGFRDAAGNVLAGAAADLRWVTCWPQLTDWRSRTFHIIPELLEQRDAEPLRKSVPQQFAVIVKVPESARPQTYTAPVTVRLAGVSTRALRLSLVVQPFRLRRPPGVVWGLYPDTARWTAFSDEQIEAEMRDFLAHGINALMMYPQWNSDWSLTDGILAADFTEFRRRMRLYHKVGLGGPMVISIQSGEHVVKTLINEQKGKKTDDAEGVYGQLLQLLKAESIAGKWPEFCLHSVDEPHGGEKLQAALRTLRTIKGMGFKTFNTCYSKAVRETLDPYLDYRCYNNIGFLSFPDAAAAKALSEETLRAGDTFWWYGTGCYTNRNFIQDGNVIANRFMGGFHFWRTRATGCWAWTFLRAKGSAFDDFDGTNHREHKDACIAYPTRDGKALTPTLQWEGIREGVDDYRYVHTLTEGIREARASGDTRRKAAADRAAAELDRLLTDMPWTCRDRAFTNGDANRTRERIAQLCVSLGME